MNADPCVGYGEQNPAHLNATESYREELKFDHCPEQAHDCLTAWNGTYASAEWDLDVVKSGIYEIKLQYSCPASDAGARIPFQCGETVLCGTTVGGQVENILLPHRGEEEHGKYVNRNWTTMTPESIELKKSRQQLRIFATTKPGNRMIDLKSITLKRK